jgi:hypothetical protein
LVSNFLSDREGTFYSLFPNGQSFVATAVTVSQTKIELSPAALIDRPSSCPRTESCRHDEFSGFPGFP